MHPVIYIALTVTVALVVALSVMLVRNKQAAMSLKTAELTAQKIIGDSKREAENIKKEALLEAKDKILSLRGEVDRQNKDRRVEPKVLKDA